MKYTWSFSNDEDLSWSNEMYDTIESCLEAACAGVDMEMDCTGLVDDPETVYIGEIFAFKPMVYATQVLADIANDAEGYDDYKEGINGWKPFDSDDLQNMRQVEELSNKLTSVVNDWFRKYNRAPNCYMVSNVKEYKTHKTKENRIILK